MRLDGVREPPSHGSGGVSSSRNGARLWRGCRDRELRGCWNSLYRERVAARSAGAERDGAPRLCHPHLVSLLRVGPRATVRPASLRALRIAVLSGTDRAQPGEPPTWG